MTVLKFVNPWVVKTPPGYSALFVPPLNRIETPFTFFSGVVETVVDGKTRYLQEETAWQEVRSTASAARRRMLA